MHGTRDLTTTTTLPEMQNFSQSRALQSRAHRLIPGGSHTYAKGDDQFPEQAPGFMVRGKGCHVWDVDGNEFIEYGMGLRAVTLGHGFGPVVEAAYRQMQLGTNFSRPAKLELDLAEAMLEIVDGAEMVKFAKNGSDVTTAAVKLARAFTGRDLIVICGDQPFFSTDDWFIGVTEMNAGIPRAISEMTLKFRYNDLLGLQNLFDQHPNQIACVLFEAEAITPPAPGFLEQVKQLCERNGAVLIFDEMITGFRWHLGGAQKFHNVIPHLSTFGKAMGNGFAISALLGKREIMRLGGIDHDHPRVFLLSTTHGAETHALAASLETIRIYREQDVVAHLWRQGERLRELVNRSIAENRLHGFLEVLGRPCNLVFATRDEQRQPSQAFRTLFLQELIRRGVIAPSFVVSYSHTDADLDRTAEAVYEAHAVYRRALDEGVEKYLKGRAVKPVNRKYNEPTAPVE
ncbi:MAG TPA: glutamate-1-semialdehyde 2,1-aminomutase [Candidatus Aquilonibacter sp.]|nr:glutamate-1-semialdehyde 2,1-aminomutase [Candidatus Aquilonibacter sp.]